MYNEKSQEDEIKHAFSGLLVLLLLATTSVAGCANPATEGDALKIGSSSLKGCTSSFTTVEREKAVHGDVITNTSDSELTVVEVSFLGSEGFTITDSYLIPVHQDDDGAYVSIGFSPFSEETSWQWEGKKPAIGGLIKLGETWNLVLQLRAASVPIAYASGAGVGYTMGEGRKIYTQHNASTLYVLDGGSCDDVLSIGSE